MDFYIKEDIDKIINELKPHYKSIAGKNFLIAGGGGFLGPYISIIVERINKILNSVITIANGKLSLKQFLNGTVLIGGGWPGLRDMKNDKFETIHENFIGNIQLACYSIPALKTSRVVRVWGGLEAETKDAMPIMGQIPNIDNAYVIGSFHSGYTSGPYVGYLMAQMILGNEQRQAISLPNRKL